MSAIISATVRDEMTGMIPTEIGYKANLKTLQARDEMVGTLLDTLA